MSRFRHVAVVGGLAALWVAAGLPVASQMPQGGATLRGVVKAADGKPLEGVAVSAKAQGSTRNIDVDNTPASPEVWLPFQQAGKVARVQVRSGMMR